MHIEAVKRERMEEMLKKYSFTPRINRNSDFFTNRNYFRIEDRLFYEHKLLQDKKNYQRFLKEIDNREKSECKTKKEKSKKSLKRSSSNELKKEFLKLQTFGESEGKGGFVWEKKENGNNKKSSVLRTIHEGDSNTDKNISSTKNLLLNKAEMEDFSHVIDTPGFLTKANTMKKNPYLHMEKSNSISNYPPEMSITPQSANSKGLTNNIGVNAYKEVANSVSSSTNNNAFLTNNYVPNRINKQISFQNRGSNNNTNSNSYSGKYEKLLSQKNLQNSNNVTQTVQQTPNLTNTPTPKNLEAKILKDNFFTEQNLNNFLMKQSSINTAFSGNTLSIPIPDKNQNYNQNISINVREPSPLHKTESSLFKFEQNESSAEKKNNKDRKSLQFNAKNNVKKRSKTVNKKLKEVSPSPNKQIHDRLYKSNEEIQNKKQEALERLMRNQCSFQPKISKESKKIISKIRKPEEKEDFINRLTNSRRVNSLAPKAKLANLSKSLSASRSRSKSQSSKNIFISNPNNLSNNPSCPNQAQKSTRNDNKTIPNTTSVNNFHSVEMNSFTPKYLLTTTNDTHRNEDKKRIREIKTEKNLYSDLKKITQEKKKTTKIFQEKFSENIGRFMLNNLKELYETFNNNGRNFEIEGVPKHVRDRLLIPTCTIINNRGLEFNFHNFFTIANEIFNNFF